MRTEEEDARLLAETFASLTEAERNYLEVLLRQEGLPGGVKPSLDNIAAIDYGTDSVFRWEPVGIEEFLFDEYYMGASTTTLYPKWKDDLEEMFTLSGIREVILAGSIGVGKTTVGSLAISRILYELSCLAHPQLTFGLSPGSEMMVSCVSKSLYLARTVLKSSIEEKLKISPYFMENFAPHKGYGGEHTTFPNSINLAIGSFQSDRVLGQNVFSGIMDEANFAGTNKQLIKSTGDGRKHAGMFDRAEKVFTGLVRRIKSRFQRAGGGFPGFMILLSSANTVGGFIDRRIRESLNDPSVFLREYAQWDIRPKQHYCGRKFYVVIGSSAMRSQVYAEDARGQINEDWVKDQGGSVIDVPIEYWEDFDRDLEGSIRDIAGINTSAISPYFSRTERIEMCHSPRLFHPFSTVEYQYGQPAKFLWEKLVEKKTRRLAGGFTEEYYQPKLNPHHGRWVHIDLALSGDSVGIAMGHVDKMVEVVRRNAEGEEFSDVAPHIVMEFMLRILPPNGEQIILADVRRLVYELQARGYQFVGASLDAFQSADSLQQFKHRGINSHLISVDRTTEAYDALRSAMYEGRVETYPYGPFESELMALEYDPQKGKIDHPVAGSKDVADAAAGVVQGLTQHCRRLPVAGPGPEMSRRREDDLSWSNPSGLIPVGDDFDLERIKSEYGHDDEFGDDTILFPLT